MNHGYPPRGIGPPAGAPSQRLNELLDQIRAEFETESQRSVDYEGQSKYITVLVGQEAGLKRLAGTLGTTARDCANSSGYQHS